MDIALSYAICALLIICVCQQIDIRHIRKELREFELRVSQAVRDKQQTSGKE